LTIATDKEFSAFEPIEKQACELGVRENVDFIVTNGLKHLRKLLSRADVAVSPRTECDGIPQKLLNYMAAGKAVVSFEGSASIIQNGVTGITVPNGNVVGFGENIIELFRNYSLRRKLGKNASEYVKKNLSWNKVAMTSEKIYFDYVTDLSLAVRIKA
jgi:glycosyltransferase involved in cell wall biosynthesis